MPDVVHDAAQTGSEGVGGMNGQIWAELESSPSILPTASLFRGDLQLVQDDNLYASIWRLMLTRTEGGLV